MTPSSNSPLTNLAERSGVIAAMALLEAIQTGELTRDACADWIQQSFHLRAAAISQRGAGAVALNEPATEAMKARFQTIADAARREVVETLRGLLARPQDDAFVSKALYAQHVRRETRGSKVIWVAHPPADSSLGTLVLLLFVVDILGYRDSYDSRLSICDECGRISFVERRGVRFGCTQHPVG